MKPYHITTTIIGFIYTLNRCAYLNNKNSIHIRTYTDFVGSKLYTPPPPPKPERIMNVNPERI